MRGTVLIVGGNQHTAYLQGRILAMTLAIADRYTLEAQKLDAPLPTPFKIEECRLEATAPIKEGKRKWKPRPSSWGRR